MRTSQKRLKELTRDAMAALGVKTEVELWAHVSKARAYFARKLEKHGFSCVQFSPYRGGDWQVSAIVPGDGVRFFFLSLSLEDWMDSPFSTCQKIVNKYTLPSGESAAL